MLVGSGSGSAGAAGTLAGSMEFSLELGQEILRRTPDALGALLPGLSDAWIDGDEGPDTWSSWQVVGHLAHIEEVDWIDRTQRILEHGTSRPFEPVDREAGFIRFEGWPIEELLARFASVRAANLDTLNALVGVQDLGRPGVHPTFGQVTLGQLLATWVAHDLNHLGQIVKALAKQYTDAVGPWREFLPILDA
jgi:DinB superfamily